ncbi:MAG: hypothetical protein ABUS57_12395 [Pseudomonadota bacterium]
MKAIKAIVIGGLIAGALDITYACVAYGLKYGVPPMRIFQSVAAGWLGRDAARAGGLQTAILGGVSHFGIAIAMAAAYVIAARWLPILLKRPVIMGVLYGALLFVIMNWIVVPYSARHGDPPSKIDEDFFIALFPHVVFVGPAIALTARAFLRVNRAA